MKQMVTLEVVKDTKKQKVGEQITTTLTKIRNFANKPGWALKGKELSYFGNVRYKIVDMKVVAPKKWEYELNFWVHGTWEGDDRDVTYRFKYEPSKEEIQALIKKAYDKYSEEGSEGECYENMKNDYSFRKID